MKLATRLFAGQRKYVAVVRGQSARGSGRKIEIEIGVSEEALAIRKGASMIRAPPLVDVGGARSALFVPLHKDEAVTGFIMIYRQEVPRQS